MNTGPLLVLTLGCWVTLGCQRPQPVAVAPPRASVSLTPGTATLTAGRTLAFTGSASTGEAVLWRVLDSDAGSVDGSGLYRAPLHAGEATLEAFLKNGTASARARITVVAPPDGRISAPPVVLPGTTGLQASVPPVPGSRYAWSVRGGTLATAADRPVITFSAGTGREVVLLCRVSNAAGDTVNSSQEVRVAAPVTLTISPATAILTVGRGMKFGFEVLGGTSSAVRWTVPSPGGGSVDASGRYTAPAVPGQYEVQVQALDEPGKLAKASVKVVPEPAGAILAPARAQAGADLEASVQVASGLVCHWEVAGGHIRAGADGPRLTLTAGSGPSLTLRCRIQNEANDSLLLTRVITLAP